MQALIKHVDSFYNATLVKGDNAYDIMVISNASVIMLLSFCLTQNLEQLCAAYNSKHRKVLTKMTVRFYERLGG